MDVRQSYQVNLEFFQGPLDLLLFLIKKQKIDIHDIPIATITKEYLEYLHQKDRINLDREAEFLLMAALLIYIKSQMLLPEEKPELEEDPRQRLVDRLLDFQKIKALSFLLGEKEEEELKKWKRIYIPSTHPDDKGYLDFFEYFYNHTSLQESFVSFFALLELIKARIVLAVQETLFQSIKVWLQKKPRTSFIR